MWMFLMAPRALRGPGHADQGSTTLHRALDLPHAAAPGGLRANLWGTTLSAHVLLPITPSRSTQRTGMSNLFAKSARYYPRSTPSPPTIVIHFSKV